MYSDGKVMGLVSGESYPMKNKLLIVLIIGVIASMLASCQPDSPPEVPEQDELQEVTLMLDWVPNTNHTGIFAAQAQGFFEDAGLAVDIVEPGEVYAEQAVSAGAADFGISFQEQVTIARSDDIPIVSIAALIQNNTSGFASRAELGVRSPKDWEGLRYGSYLTLETWSRFVTAAGFELIEHYFRPPGRPRSEQPWLATVWRAL